MRVEASTQVARAEASAWSVERRPNASGATQRAQYILFRPVVTLLLREGVCCDLALHLLQGGNRVEWPAFKCEGRLKKNRSFANDLSVDQKKVLDDVVQMGKD